MNRASSFFVFDTKLFLKLFLAFIVATVAGTILHELGHYIVAKCYGYEAGINYASTYWKPADPDGFVPASDSFYILLGGPIQTLLTGTVGLVVMFRFRKKYFSAKELNWKQWAMVFLTLFWLRPAANFTTVTADYILNSEVSASMDEIRIASYLQWPGWSIISVTAVMGFVVLAVVVFTFIPVRQRFTFLAAGLLGGISGYILWLEMFGKYVMP